MQLKIENISFRYNDKSPWILKDINMKIESGERVGIIAPSGYGKSTLAKIIAGYENPTCGKILIDGKEINKNGFCPVQMIHQHPELSVNPRWKMEKVLNECWNPDDKMLEKLGIEKEWLKRWPAELSGGELQRFCIARVLSPDTKFLICDEITTMLDVISQAQIWKALIEIADEKDYGMLIITHNMHLAERICTRIIDLRDINRRV
ncbi:ATP-binding cassette domain-containing protein [Peptacetobacter hominis]|uniref:ATP-binding cassette domain-containing protein n=1 Tax=Peptacetobacter hominis TaxID=2743610 RepID=A0A544QY16_9FIRM|nr:ATP-binding cassette domain-containing protein [Peptacetobacter hominis]TQQ85538.1 ATP-binding cassette domain-containing protein [Peptacetobacter hominis]